MVRLRLERMAICCLISPPCYLGPSAAGFRLRYVTLNLFGVGPDNGTNEKTPTIVNVNLRNRADVVLLHHHRVLIDDVDLAQRNLRIASCHLFDL